MYLSSSSKQSVNDALTYADLDLLGSRVRVGVPPEVFVDLLALYIVPLPRHGSESIDHFIEVLEGEQWLLIVDGETRFEASDLQQVKIELVGWLNFVAFDGDPSRLHLHAGLTISPAGRSALIVGPSGAGKTTLSAALVELGHSAITDEVVAVTDGSTIVEGLAKPLWLKSDPLGFLRNKSTTFPVAVSGRSETGPRSAFSVVDMVVFPRFSTTEVPGQVSIPTHEAVATLVLSSQDVRRFGHGALRSLMQLALFAPAIELTFDDALDAARTVSRLLDLTATPTIGDVSWEDIGSDREIVTTRQGAVLVEHRSQTVKTRAILDDGAATSSSQRWERADPSRLEERFHHVAGVSFALEERGITCAVHGVDAMVADTGLPTHLLAGRSAPAFIVVEQEDVRETVNALSSVGFEVSVATTTGGLRRLQARSANAPPVTVSSAIGPPGLLDPLPSQLLQRSVTLPWLTSTVRLLHPADRFIEQCFEFCRARSVRAAELVVFTACPSRSFLDQVLEITGAGPMAAAVRRSVLGAFEINEGPPENWTSWATSVELSGAMEVRLDRALTGWHLGDEV